MSEPRTEAGKRLLLDCDDMDWLEMRERILAIEAEAAPLDGLREAREVLLTLDDRHFLDGLDVERFGDAVMAALRLRLVHGATDATYTPREVAEMVRHVIEKQVAALRDEGETT